MASHSARTEMFVLLFASLALLSFLYNLFSLSIIFGFIVAETHPIGIGFLFNIIPFLFEKTFKSRIKGNLLNIILVIITVKDKLIIITDN